MSTHKSLKAWQHAQVLAVECAKAARHFPPEEQGALADQLRRAAYSAALNIAEGSGRRGSREYRRFLDIAKGSLDEVDAILEIARDLGYLELSAFARLEARREEAAKTLYGLLRSVSASAAAK
jgi:four helix bundle protein